LVIGVFCKEPRVCFPLYIPKECTLFEEKQCLTLSNIAILHIAFVFFFGVEKEKVVNKAANGIYIIDYWYIMLLLYSFILFLTILASPKVACNKYCNITPENSHEARSNRTATPKRPNSRSEVTGLAACHIADFWTKCHCTSFAPATEQAFNILNNVKTTFVCKIFRNFAGK